MKSLSSRVATALLVCGMPWAVQAQMPWETSSEPEPVEARPTETQPETTPEETSTPQLRTMNGDSQPEVVEGVSTVSVTPSESSSETDLRLVSATLNLDGTVGLQNLSSAWGGAPHTYRIALMTQFFTGSNAIRFNDTNDFFAGNLLIEASPIRYFSTSLRLRAQSNVNSFGRPEAMLSQGDAVFGLKGYFDVSPGVYLGLDSSFFIPTGFGSTGLDFDGLGVRPRLLMSVNGGELSDEQFHLNAHFNLGYKVDRSENLVPTGVIPTRVERFAYGLSAYDAVELGLGVEYELPYVTPFLAWNLAIPVNGADGVCEQANLACVSDIGFPSFPNVLSLGAKAQPIQNLAVHVGMDIGLTADDAAGLPVTLPWEMVIGLQWTIDPTPKVVFVEKESETKDFAAAPTGLVLGTVVNRETDAPIEGAIIRYPLGNETSQATDSSGVFRSYTFMPGSKIRFSISHPEYESLDVDRTLPAEPGEHPLKIQLKALPNTGEARGDVRDESGNPIAGATLKFSGTQELSATSTGAGTFSQKLKAGRYSVAASAAGFLTRGREIEVVPDKPTDLSFVLGPAPSEDLVELRDDKIEIRQTIYFDNGLATIQARSFPLLQQVTALLVENPQVRRISIEGHTDDVGPEDFNMELSQRRAEAVRQYLIDQGVNAERLVAKGFGQTRPILPNTSNRNRGINRRVEFRIGQ